METDEDYLPMSGIQHFAFCRRQWALIHIENQWVENVLTAEGRVEHKKAHDENSVEKRRDLIITHGMRVSSSRLKLSGACDVVEFHKDEAGVPLHGYEGKWTPLPVEYKHGVSKASDVDRIQLCAEAMALEDMLVCDVRKGALFYETTKNREYVEISDDLRAETTRMAKEMWKYFTGGYTPNVKPKSGCKKCSLYDICMPKLVENMSVKDYIAAQLKDKE